MATNEPNPSLPDTNWNQNQYVASAKIYRTEFLFDSQFLDNLKLILGYSYNKGEYIKMSIQLTSYPSTVWRPGDNYALDIFN